MHLDRRFQPPVRIRDGKFVRSFPTVVTALEFLASYPEAKRSAGYWATVEIVKHAERGIIEVSSARRAFSQYAKDMGILAESEGRTDSFPH